MPQALKRCSRCKMHEVLCICADLPFLKIKTRVIVVMHSAEQKRVSNSGRLVPLCLEGGEVRLRGVRGQQLKSDDLLEPERRSIFLYPRLGSQLLSPKVIAQDPRPITLIVPDGNWRQARKVALREPSFKDLQPYHLPPGPPSRYRLRSSPSPDRLSTFEAISRALILLEGEVLRAPLERAFDLLVERTLWTRGQISAAEVRGGISDEARHAGNPLHQRSS